MGLVVDNVNEVVYVDARQIEPTPPLGYGSHDHFLLGIARVRDRVTMLLDAGRVADIDALPPITQVLESESTTLLPLE